VRSKQFTNEQNEQEQKALGRDEERRYNNFFRASKVLRVRKDSNALEMLCEAWASQDRVNALPQWAWSVFRLLTEQIQNAIEILVLFGASARRRCQGQSDRASERGYRRKE
jgi:hypothetical protein